jgi:hypothetical protein
LTFAAAGLGACGDPDPECCCALPDAATVDAAVPDAAPPDVVADATPALPELLPDFERLMEALEAGAEVSLVLHYARCTLDGAGPGPDAIGGMTVDPWEYFAPGVVYNPLAYVSTSESALILLQNDHLINYVKVRAYEDGTVGVVAEYLDPVTYAVEMHEEFDCEMADGPESEVGAWFFRR